MKPSSHAARAAKAPGAVASAQPIEANGESLGSVSLVASCYYRQRRSAQAQRAKDAAYATEMERVGEEGEEAGCVPPLLGRG